MVEYLENQFLRIAVSPMGAELTSLWDKTLQQEFLWQADPAIWNRHSPLLFPVVGGLNHGGIRHKGQFFALKKHGFAMDSLFQKQESHHKLAFQLTSSPQTLEVYPFAFCLDVEYSLQERTCKILHRVTNIGEETLYFSLGAHPGFALNGNIEDYYLEFSKDEKLESCYRISDEVLVPTYKSWQQRIPITPSLFNENALIFENLQRDEVSLNNTKNSSSVRVTWDKNFTTLGIWAKKNAPYVCIEPWAGIDDREDFHGEISEKKGILSLPPKAQKELEYTIQIISV
ncbi:MAG: aldose 1-epimerase family protein [Brevinema sp.]